MVGEKRPFLVQLEPAYEVEKFKTSVLFTDLFVQRNNYD